MDRAGTEGGGPAQTRRHSQSTEVTGVPGGPRGGTGRAGGIGENLRVGGGFRGTTCGASPVGGVRVWSSGVVFHRLSTRFNDWLTTPPQGPGRIV